MFSVSEPISVLDFLNQYKTQSRDLDVSKNEAYNSIIIFSRSTALDLFNSI